jgi:hypothetical protein
MLCSAAREATITGNYDHSGQHLIHNTTLETRRRQQGTLYGMTLTLTTAHLGRLQCLSHSSQEPPHFPAGFRLHCIQAIPAGHLGWHSINPVAAQSEARSPLAWNPEATRDRSQSLQKHLAMREAKRLLSTGPATIPWLAMQNPNLGQQ